MTPKERLLKVISNSDIDRTSWSPNMAYWWTKANQSIIDMGEVGFLKSIGADPLIRGHYPMTDRNWDHLFLFSQQFKHNCQMRERVEGNDKYIEYITPVGTLTAHYIYSEAGETWFLIGHPVKKEEDFKILRKYYESMYFTPNYKRYQENLNIYGDDILMIPLLVPNMKSSFQAMIEYWVGTEELVYALMDYPETVEETLAIMEAKHLDSVKISVEAGAPVYLSWEDTSTTNISPLYYQKYIKPEIDNWCDVIHEAGAKYLQHACGTLQYLVHLMGDSKIDGIESISPPPTGDIELWEARKHLRPSQVLIGGIEPTVFLNSTMEELIPYVYCLLEKMEGTPFILANSDSCPPGVELEKFHEVGRIVKEMV